MRRSSEMSTIPENAPGFDEAHKLDKGLREGLTTPEELSRADERLLQMIEGQVDEQWIQKVYKPVEFWKVEHGHIAEQKALLVLEAYCHATGDIFTIRKATAIEDQIGNRLDVEVGIAGSGIEVPLQLTTSKEGEVHRDKQKKTPADTPIVIISPDIDRYDSALARHHVPDICALAHPVMLQMLEQLHQSRNPDYQRAYNEVLPQIAARLVAEREEKKKAGRRASA